MLLTPWFILLNCLHTVSCMSITLSQVHKLTWVKALRMTQWKTAVCQSHHFHTADIFVARDVTHSAVIKRVLASWSVAGLTRAVQTCHPCLRREGHCCILQDGIKWTHLVSTPFSPVEMSHLGNKLVVETPGTWLSNYLFESTSVTKPF